MNAQIKALIREDPFHFNVDSFYLMKNEKMIILLQVLERGNDFIVFTSKGAELQETTVCHAEENEHINEVMENVFDKGKCNPAFSFSLAPLKQLEFKLYEDLKYTLSGTIENPDFIDLVKNYFMRILAYKLKTMLNQGVKFPKVITGSLSNEEIVDSQLFLDRNWLEFL